MTTRLALTTVFLPSGFGGSTTNGFGGQPAASSSLFGASTNTGGGFGGGMSQYLSRVNAAHRLVFCN